MPKRNKKHFRPRTQAVPAGAEGPGSPEMPGPPAATLLREEPIRPAVKMDEVKMDAARPGQPGADERFQDAPGVPTGQSNLGQSNLERLPLELRARVRRERQQGATWEEIEEMSSSFEEWSQVPVPVQALFPGRRLDRALLQGRHRQRLEQVRREEREEAEQARARAAEASGAASLDLPRAVEGALRDRVFALLQSSDEASREKAMAELHKLAKLLVQNRKLDLMEERLRIDQRRMALLESQHEMRQRKMEGPALKTATLKNEALKNEAVKNNEATETQGQPGGSSVAHAMAPEEIPSPEKDREDEAQEAPEDEDPYAALAEAHFAETGTRVTPAGLRECHRRMNGFREQDAQGLGMTLEQLLATLPYRGGVDRLYDLPYPLRPGEALEELAESPQPGDWKMAPGFRGSQV